MILMLTFDTESGETNGKNNWKTIQKQEKEPKIVNKKLQWKGKMSKLEAVTTENFPNDNECKNELVNNINKSPGDFL